MNSDVETRHAAVVQCLSRTDADVVDDIVAFLGDPEWRVRKEAVHVAEVLAGRLPALVDRVPECVFQRENVGMRSAAMELWASLIRRSETSILEHYDTAPEYGRKFVLLVMGQARHEEFVPHLARCLDDPDPNIVAAAIEGLGQIGGDAACGALRSLLHDDELYRRVAAIESLASLNVRVPYDELLPVISDPLSARAAVPLLGISRDVRAIPRLVDLLRDGRRSVIQSAILALSRFTDDPEVAPSDIAEALART